MGKAAISSGKFNRLMHSKVAKILCLLLVIVLVAAGLIKFKIIKIPTASEATVAQRISQVRRGDLELKLSGSGAANSANEEELTTVVGGTVTKVYFNKGDKVKAGDLLYEIDDSAAQLSYAEAKNNLSQSEIALNDTLDSISSLKVTAPFDGLVTGLAVKKGEMVNKNSSVMTITDESTMVLTLTFYGITADEVSLNQKVTVYIQSMNQSIEGKVSDISSTGKSNECSLEIEIKNPGLLDSGMEANASITTSKGEIWSDGTAKLEPINTQVIKSDASGVVKELYASNNKFVKGGNVLMVLEDTSLAVTKASNELKIEGLKSTLANKEKQLGYYKITAPIEGTIITQNIKAGDEVKAGDSIGTVSNNNTLKMEISIDELDIAKVKAGMDARVTVDALNETTLQPIAGKVTDISPTGTSSGGVTTYPITVTFDNNGNIKAGMNATAVIILSKAENTLYVPLEAVQTRGGQKTVWVQKKGTSNGNMNQNGSGANTQGRRGYPASGEGSAMRGYPASGNGARMGGVPASREGAAMRGYQGNGNGTRTRENLSGSSQSSNTTTVSDYYSNAVQVPVETGVNNESYIEIKSGLNEGEIVILPPIVQSTSKNSNSGQSGMNGMGFMGGMSGGMPGGGIPGGGMSGNWQGGNRQGSNRQSGGGSR